MPIWPCYLDCHEAGLCCYLVIHIENLLLPLLLFYFHLWPLYWLSLVHTDFGPLTPPPSTVPIRLDKASAPTLSLLGLLDQNLYIHKHSKLLTQTLKMEAACASKASATLTTSTWSIDPRAELTSTTNHPSHDLRNWLIFHSESKLSQQICK
jgi:hypothetical protein